MGETITEKTERYCTLFLGLTKEYNTFKEEFQAARKETGMEKAATKNMLQADILFDMYTGQDRVYGLPFDIQNEMENAFDTDFGKVKIHTGPEAETITKANNARAVTIGYNIYFGGGMYNIHTEEGRQLLLHELTHVRQYQKGETMVYVEDREELEDTALHLEATGAGLSLHTAALGQFDGGTNFNAEEKERSYAEKSTPLTDIPETERNLDEFSERGKERDVILEYPDGEMVTMKETAYNELIETTIKELGDWINGECAIRREEERERLMLGYMKWVGKA